MAEAGPRFCVLGRSLAGLTSAYLLQRSCPRARILVVGPASSRVAGQVCSVRGRRGQVFETGFHSSVLVNKNGREMLGLLRLLGLDDEVVSAHIESSARRHLLHYGRVQLFPRVQHMLRFCPAMLAEPLWPRSSAQDESVHAFVKRRCSGDVADRIADPICRGMLGGDARELSVRSCFPRLWFNERRFRSVFLGSMLSTFSAYRRRSWLSLDVLDPLLQRVSAGGRCYTLRSGMSALLDRLEDRLLHPEVGARPVEIIDASVERVHVTDASPRAEVKIQLSSGRSEQAEAVIGAVPPAELARLLEASGLDAPAGGSTVSALLRGVEFRRVGVVNLGFAGEVLKGRFTGAGYFAGSLEQQEVLGMAWTSQLFPGLYPGTHLTVYVGGEAAGGEAQAQAAALAAVRSHLGVDAEPEEVHVTTWESALPQYTIGHHQMLRDLNTARQSSLPWLQVAGPGYYGSRGPADDIVDARQLVDTLSARFARFPGLVENEMEEDLARRYGGGFDAE